MQSTNITIIVPQIVRVTTKTCQLGEVVKITGENKALVKRLYKENFYTFSELKPQKRVFSTLRLVEALEKLEAGLTVNALGETSFILELATENRGDHGIWWKLPLVSLSVFFGAAFAIMTFNQDVDVAGVFGILYKLTGLKEKPPVPVLEIGYCLGLPLGITVFFNHFSKLRISNDPTPLEVQMRTYEQEVNQAILANAEREGKVEDVT